MALELPVGDPPNPAASPVSLSSLNADLLRFHRWEADVVKVLPAPLVGWMQRVP
ncbi:hypothetical protein J2W79_000707 [Methylorubrum extorquens]|nr:hypothetical protein [Methylorubrum extorquens]